MGFAVWLCDCNFVTSDSQYYHKCTSVFHCCINILNIMLLSKQKLIEWTILTLKTTNVTQIWCINIPKCSPHLLPFSCMLCLALESLPGNHLSPCVAFYCSACELPRCQGLICWYHCRDCLMVWRGSRKPFLLDHRTQTCFLSANNAKMETGLG